MAAKKSTIRQITLTREGQSLTFNLDAETVTNPSQFEFDGGLELTGPEDGDGIEINCDTLHLWQDITMELDPLPDDAPVPVRRYKVED